MKKILILLFSFFLLSSHSVFADDISDFQIEGISIGDSLLDYMTEDEILEEIDNSERYYYLNEPNKFAEIYLKQGFSLYDNISVFISTEPSSQYLTNKNEKFIIVSVRGIIVYNEEFDSCIIQRDKIIKDLSKMFPNSTKTENIFSHSADPSGDSIVDYVDYELDSGASIYINCQDFEEVLRARKKWSDSLNIVTQTKEVSDWFETD
jgi:hypothetical protein